MVAFVVKFDFLQQLLQLLPAAMYIANYHQPLVLHRQMLLVQRLDLNHVLELWPHVCPKSRLWRVVHLRYFLSILAVSWSEKRPPAKPRDDRNDQVDGEIALNSPWDATRRPLDHSLPLRRYEVVVVPGVEAVFFIRNVEGVVGDKVDERMV